MQITDTHALPVEFTSRLQSLVPPTVGEQILLALSSNRPTTFRVNRLKTDKDTLTQSLKAQGFKVEDVPWYTDAYVLKNKSLRELSETNEYTNGHLYVQSLSSMIPPLVLDPRPGEHILDIAAAPGSKTTQIAAMMGNVGELVANDSSRVRGYRLAANIKMQGATMTAVTQYDARSVWQHNPEYYDKTLVDVPCSMEGRFNVTDPRTYTDWSLKKVKELSRLQRWILRSAVSATKPNGRIVYSTCTLSPEENEEVVDWILKKEKGNIALEEIHIESLPVDPALHTWGNTSYDASIGNSVRIYPSSLMEGFYIASFKKLKSTIPEAMRR